jgi:hypothetical protein
MNKNIVHLSILSVVMMPLCAMHVAALIDDMPGRCTRTLQMLTERPVLTDGAGVIPHVYSQLPALGTFHGKKVLAMSEADRSLITVCTLLSSNALLYSQPTWLITGQENLELLIYDHLCERRLDQVCAGYQRVINELKTGWRYVNKEQCRCVLLPLDVMTSDDYWFFFNEKTGHPEKKMCLRHIDRLIRALSDFYGVPKTVYSCSEEWRGSCEWGPVSPCSSPVTTSDGQCCLCVHKQALTAFDHVFGFNLAALVEKEK